jgi:hypothetical protein
MLSKLPCELKVFVIEHATDNVLERNSTVVSTAEVTNPPSTRDLFIKLTRQNQSNNSSRLRFTLPRLPAIYNINRFFRSEFLRLKSWWSLQQVLIGKIIRLDVRASLALSPRYCAVVVINFTASDHPTSRLNFIMSGLSPAIKPHLEHLIGRTYHVGPLGLKDAVMNALCDPSFPRLRSFHLEIGYKSDF